MTSRTKTDRVREWIGENPDGTAADCVAALVEHGVESTTFYNARASMRKAAGKTASKKSPAKAPAKRSRKRRMTKASPVQSTAGTMPAGTSTDTVQMIQAAHQFVSQIGGRANAREALANYDRLSSILSS